MNSKEDIHTRLLTKLTEYIDVTINEHAFLSLKKLLLLTPKENIEANRMSSLLTILERNDIIAPGKYKKLKDALSNIDVRINREVIEPAEAEIQILESKMLTSQGRTEIVPHTSQETVPYYSLEHPGLDYQLNIFLIKIARELVAEDIENMKFLLGGECGTARSVLEQILTPLKLFDHLIKDGKLSRDNILFLQAMLFHARRIDLFKQLMDYGKHYRNILHFYEPSGNPANGYRDVKFHVACKENLSRNELEDIRTMAAKYMCVAVHLVFIRGCEVKNSFLITIMVPEVCLEYLLNLDSSEKQSFLSLGIDFLMVDDKKFCTKEGLIEKEELTSDNQIVLNLKYYMQQTATLQKKLEQYQLKEMAKHVPHCSAYSSISWTLTAAMFYLILRDQRKGPLESDSKANSSNVYFKLMEKIKSLNYDMELIESLLEARSLVERKLNMESHRLLMIQQTAHMQMLEHMIERAKFKENKLKFLLQIGLNDPILSEKDEIIFHLQQLQPFLTENIQIEVGVGQSIDRDQIEPIFTKMSAELQEKDMRRLRKTFQVNPDEETMLRNLNHCFIQILAIFKANRTGMVDIEKFGEKIISAVDRKDFEDKWKECIDDIVEGQKQKGADAGKDKDSEVFHQLASVNKKMANVENLIRKSKSSFKFDDNEDNIMELLNYLSRKQTTTEPFA
ncbi:uncharacterized protein LOC127717781 [Mytilus californianus]|uniref:uncharacterized protein LOC127717781 n=1 Tax=Mytilus californianus TaxID=6549 RepID=UPI002247C0CA|nr:uncharacterized protein LOC127717781 [Mytilus californianus]